MTLMWSARICFLTAVIFGVNACTRGNDHPAPAVASSPESAPVPPPAISSATPVEAPISPTKKPRVTQPAASQATTKDTAPVAKAPTPIPKAPKPATAAAAPTTLDLTALEKQLKSTKAIGIFSKIALKNQVDDLMKQFREHYQGKSNTTMVELRQSYDLLMLKVLSLVQDDDKTLAAAIVSSRAAIWDLLADPKKFAELDA